MRVIARSWSNQLHYKLVLLRIPVLPVLCFCKSEPYRFTTSSCVVSPFCLNESICYSLQASEEIGAKGTGVSMLHNPPQLREHHLPVMRQCSPDRQIVGGVHGTEETVREAGVLDYQDEFF